ncbi:MAG: lactonase family protein [Acidobacteria bacterium]|nr:lactonase family protein [Acidobacteriota bacterium]
MKTTRRTFLVTAAWAPAIMRAAQASAQGGERLVYVGTYTNNNAGSKGIYAFRFNPSTGQATALGVAAETDSPSWLALHPNGRFLYAANELPPPEAGGPDGAITAFSINATSGALTQISRSKTNGRAPAHMLVDRSGKWAIAGNYGDGPGAIGTSIVVFPIGSDGRLPDAPAQLVPHTPRPKKVDPNAAPGAANPPTSHPHCVLMSPDNKFLVVAEKGWDQIVVYTFDAASGMLTPNTPPAVDATKLRAAPRHLAFHPNGKYLYVCYEAGRAVSTFAWDAASGSLTALDTHDTLPPDAPRTGSCGEIEVHPDGKHLYVSNRGHNSLALFAIDQANGTLAPQGHFPAGGTPRNFKIDPTGDWVITEGQNVHKSFVQRIDRASGKLTMTDVTLDAPAPVCIVFV